MSGKIKIAGIQMEPVILDKDRNLTRCLELMKTAAGEKARLIVFPEAALNGYIFNSLEEALPSAEPIPGPSTEKIARSCHQMNVYVVIGLLERDGNKIYNAAALLGPSGLIGKYRKLHLPYVGVDRFLNHGDLPLLVYETEVGRIGLSICYDLDFPEQARVLALMGAEIIVTITNWPEGVEFIPDYVVQTRARENLVHHIAVNRVGEERGFRFFGRSKFASYMGVSLAEGRPYQEDIIYAEVDPALAKEKHQVMVPGELEVDMARDRRPEFYHVLTQPLVDTSRIRK
jgi:predicted amidohydrolase